MLTLFKLDASPPVRSVYMTLAALNIIDVEYVDVDLIKGENATENYRKMNPQHTVPLLKDGDFYIWDSHAINVYLVRKFRGEDELYPQDLKQRAIIDQRMHFDSGILFPSLKGAIGPILFGSEKSFARENIERIEQAYEFTEQFLTHEFLAGPRFSLADICCYTTLSTLDVVLPVDGKIYPKLTSYLVRCSHLELSKKVNEPGLRQFRDLLREKLE